MKGLIIGLIAIVFYLAWLGRKINKRNQEAEIRRKKIVEEDDMDVFPIPDLSQFRTNVQGPVELPRFMKVAQIQADREGISVEEFLDRDLQKALNSNYPTPECLSSEEISACKTIDILPRDIENHLAECDHCRALVVMAKMSDQ